MRHHLNMMQECSLQSMLVSNPGLLINIPSRFDSLTPLINKSASLSINSIIFCVSWAPQKDFFSVLRASFWSKNKGGAGPPGPYPRYTTVVY